MSTQVRYAAKSRDDDRAERSFLDLELERGHKQPSDFEYSQSVGKILKNPKTPDVTVLTHNACYC